MTKKIFIMSFIAFALIAPGVHAAPKPKRQPMNKIQLQLVKEMWAKTTSARVTVNMAAVLNQSGLANTHKTLYSKLNQISSKGEWHITAFNRYKDSSGLEKLNASAEARLPEGELPGLRDRAKKISVPGQTYTIGNIEFKPSLADMQVTRAQVREAIYGQANDELARVNKVLGGGYFIHHINFIQGQPIVQQRQYKTRAMVMEAAPAAADASALAISDKVTMTATVVIASRVAANQ